MFVRTAGLADIGAIRDLLAETWHATYDSIHGVETVNRLTRTWHSPAALKRQVDQPDSEFLVADDGERIGGVAYAVADPEGKTVSLQQLYVRPGLQGRGIGSMLLDEIFESYPDAERVRLEVDEANKKAIAFYVAQGFEQAGRTENCGKASSGIPALIYERLAGSD